MVRHPLVQKIVKAYDEYESRMAKEQTPKLIEKTEINHRSRKSKSQRQQEKRQRNK